MNFLLDDMLRAALAVFLFPILLLIPGYLIASWGGFCGFSQRSPSERLALGLVSSVTVMPALIYGVARPASLEWACALLVAASILFSITTLVRQGWRGLVLVPNTDRRVVGVAVIWAGSCIFLMSDFQMGERLYPNVIAHDYAWRSAVTGAITRTDIPPLNPAFSPGSPVALYYYYFWFMTCSAVDVLGGTFVDPRAALTGGTVWLGFALMAVTALYVRLYWPQGTFSGRSPIFLAWGLLLVAGLDVVPVMLFHVAQLSKEGLVLMPSLEWWNEAVGSWPHSLIWVPHHVAAVIAALTVLLVMTHVHKAQAFGTRLGAIVFGAIGLVSLLGLSVWIALTFAAFWCAWLVICVLRGWRTEARDGILMAALGAMLAVPFILELMNANVARVTALVLSIRRFEPLHRWLERQEASEVTVAMADALSLPINYVLEFGFFVLAAMVYWARRWAMPRPLRREELACVVLAGTALCVGTFLRSTIVNNDLGYRSVLFVQFILLLWAVAAVHALHEPVHRRVRPRRGMILLLAGSAVIGIMGLLYDVVAMKLYAMVDDLQLPARRLYAFLREEDLGRRYYDYRQAYTWIQKRLPETAIVQHNPDVFMDVPGGLYANRQAIAADRYYGPQFGIGRDLYRPVAASLIPIFTLPAMQRQDVLSVCQRFGVTALVVKRSDPIWRYRDSWIYREPAAFENASTRIFLCDELFREQARTDGTSLAETDAKEGIPFLLESVTHQH